ncbi:ATP-dependent dethiobiotin synthetase BioD [Gephyromycinifex aptenodytis]|uniref:ATP-dependent dethiobiotin synthetase BioD n=1 Tax=Gephyromycinifex aptenodytis TaxID=2716227 RepID=UPI0014457FF8|nr:ATP-dependent dethiobiotin synthetase BioD [Gephyromycinifex aptenodytis]
MVEAQIVLVAGTNTDIGKTVAAAALVAIARQRLALAYVKPAQTGLQPDQTGSDADEVRRLVGPVETHEFLRLPDPLAPAAAARVAGVSIPDVAEHARDVAQLARRGDLDLLIVEGAGGLLVRLDESGGTQADLAAALIEQGLKVTFVVVADPVLGTLNLCALTQEALDARGLPCAGYVFGSWPQDPPLVCEQNVIDLPQVTGKPLLGRIPAGAGQLRREEFVAAAPSWLTDPFHSRSEPGSPMR